MKKIFSLMAVAGLSISLIGCGDAPKAPEKKTPAAATTATPTPAAGDKKDEPAAPPAGDKKDEPAAPPADAPKDPPADAPKEPEKKPE